MRLREGEQVATLAPVVGSDEDEEVGVAEADGTEPSPPEADESTP
jgi:hypothetical protein